jgi:prepilin-type processing-associated H-X9-DG protein
LSVRFFKTLAFIVETASAYTMVWGRFQCLRRSCSRTKWTKPWVNVPNNPKAGADDFHSLHPGGYNFLFGDGSIRFVKETINPQVFSYLSTQAGGEVVSSDQF